MQISLTGRLSTPLSTPGVAPCRLPCHFRWAAKCLFISNMVTLSFPNTLRSLSSARISRRFSGFCRLCERMYSQTLLTTCPRGSGPEPTTAVSSSEGWSGFCRAFALPSLDFFSRVFVGIDFLHLPCGAQRAANRCRRLVGPCSAHRKREPVGSPDRGLTGTAGTFLKQPRSYRCP